MKKHLIVTGAGTLAMALFATTFAAEDIRFETIQAKLKDKPFTLEVADTDAKRERGLMNRDTLAADHGMLFVFDSAGRYAFWMKNTKIPLDLVFLDGSGKVVGIYSLKPNDETQVACDADSLFAIELPAGTAKTLDLKTGDTATLPEKVLKRNTRPDEK
jgi:uncharacterized membrane protein (UPF0127 family)